MKDTQLYQQLLGLTEEWEICNVEIAFEKLEVNVFIETKDKKYGKCPECSKSCSIYDVRDERNWRHLDTMQFKTILHCKIPRINCEEHGIKTVRTDWAEKHSRHTILFEKWAIQVLLGCNNRTQAKKLLGLSWDEVNTVQDRAVKRGLCNRKELNAEFLGVDEKSFLKGHKYVTVVYDIENSSVIDIAKDRKEFSLDEILSKLSSSDKKSIKAVTVDMWKPFAASIKKNLPMAKIVHDKFHIEKHASIAVDTVRKQENKSLIQDGIEYLKQTKYIWLKKKENMSDKQEKLFQDLFAKNLKVGYAWSLKEFFKIFWSLKNAKAAKMFLKIWTAEVLKSNLKPMIKFAEMINNNLSNILNYIDYNITNAVAEGINSKIQYIKYSARGFRNFENYRTAILFYCGKLDMFPQTFR